MMASLDGRDSLNVPETGTDVKRDVAASVTAGRIAFHRSA